MKKSQYFVGWYLGVRILYVMTNENIELSPTHFWVHAQPKQSHHGGLLII